MTCKILKLDWKSPGFFFIYKVGTLSYLVCHIPVLLLMILKLDNIDNNFHILCGLNILIV